MRCWMIQIGELLPTDGGSPRLFRTALLARQLARRGHDVTWWASAYDYRHMRFRARETLSVNVADNYRVVLLHGGRYRHGLSLERIRYHRRLAREFWRYAPTAPRPDLILASYPTIELSLCAVRFGLSTGTPVVVDVRDLWPDILDRGVPSPLRPLARIALSPMRRSAAEVFRDATAVCGVTQDIVQWGLEYGRRQETAWDRSFPHGYARPNLSPAEREAAGAFWHSKGLDLREPEFLVVYLGGLGNIFDSRAVLDAAEILAAEQPEIRFVICGAGSKAPLICEAAQRLPNVVFGGWIGEVEIWSLLQAASAGLLSYHSTFDYEASIPNKPIEYLSAGVPVVSSLQCGPLRVLLEENESGIHYEALHGADLALKLKELYGDPERLAETSANSKQLFERRFNSNHVYDAMSDHLERIAREAGERFGLRE